MMNTFYKKLVLVVGIIFSLSGNVYAQQIADPQQAQTPVKALEEIEDQIEVEEPIIDDEEGALSPVKEEAPAGQNAAANAVVPSVPFSISGRSFNSDGQEEAALSISRDGNSKFTITSNGKTYQSCGAGVTSPCIIQLNGNNKRQISLEIVTQLANGSTILHEDFYLKVSGKQFRLSIHNTYQPQINTTIRETFAANGYLSKRVIDKTVSYAARAPGETTGRVYTYYVGDVTTQVFTYKAVNGKRVLAHISQNRVKPNGFYDYYVFGYGYTRNWSFTTTVLRTSFTYDRQGNFITKKAVPGPTRHKSYNNIPASSKPASLF